MNRIALLATALAAPLAPALSAQDPCEGNGLGSVYIETTPTVLGAGFEINLGSPDLPGGIGILAYSTGYGPITLPPPFGTSCLDILAPNFTATAVVLDGTGNANLVNALPDDPILFGANPLFVSSATLNGASIELAKTVPFYFEYADSYSPTGLLGFARSMHRATSLGLNDRDNRIQVLVSGGGDGTVFETQSTATTELFNPLERTLTSGPDMSEARAYHTATLLDDGRVLLAGGNAGSGVASATAEIYDHTTGTITPTGSMTTARTGHSAVKLDDGRVLVTGGLSDYQNAGTALATALNNAQNTGEVYDPNTGVWTAVSNTMASDRSGHVSLLEADGRVLVISGVSGGVPTGLGTDVPVFTNTCDWYDPTTNAFVAAPPIPIGRGFHNASRLGSGDVLVTGGLITAGPFGEALATSTCYRFDGATWTQTGSIPIGVAFHSQVALEDGGALISGGYLGDFVTLVATANHGVHDGTSYSARTDIGTNEGLPSAQASPRGAHTMTRLWDGSFLLLGGFDSPDTSTILVLGDGFIVTP